MSAPDAMVEAVAGGIDTENVAPDVLALGFALQRSAFLVLADAMREEQPSPQIFALVSIHAGGMHPELLDEAVKRSTSLEQLRQNLILDNLIFLQDSSPRPRVRAYDWLVLHDQEPEGYDPLAEAQERREAIERFKASLLEKEEER